MTDFNLGESILSLQTMQAGYDKFIIFLLYIFVKKRTLYERLPFWKGFFEAFYEMQHNLFI